MANKPFIAKDHIESLNRLKCDLLETKVPFTERRIRYGLKRCGIPANRTFWDEFKKNLLQKVQYDGYLFIHTDPIHYNILEGIYENYKKKLYSNNNKKINNKNEDIEVQKAIDLLKSKGYKIYKEV